MAAQRLYACLRARGLHTRRGRAYFRLLGDAPVHKFRIGQVVRGQGAGRGQQARQQEQCGTGTQARCPMSRTGSSHQRTWVEAIVARSNASTC